MFKFREVEKHFDVNEAKRLNAKKEFSEIDLDRFTNGTLVLEETNETAKKSSYLHDELMRYFDEIDKENNNG